MSTFENEFYKVLLSYSQSLILHMTADFHCWAIFNMLVYISPYVDTKSISNAVFPFLERTPSNFRCEIPALTWVKIQIITNVS